MNKILVPTDFSPNALRAIDYAVQIAKINQATIYIIHVCDHLFQPDLGNVLSKAEFNTKKTDEAFSKLELIRSSIEDTENVLVNIQLYSGTITETIVIAAEEHQADIIVMGTLGISGVNDFVFGSKTAAVIKNSSIPVIAIPVEYDWKTPSKFLLAINHFEEVSDLLFPALDLAGVFNAEVRIAIFTDEDKAGAAEFVSNAKEIKFAGEKLKKKYADIVINAEHLSGSRFEESINDYVETNQVDLLVMMTHKRSFIRSVFTRSLTRKMSYHSKVPILAIPF